MSCLSCLYLACKPYKKQEIGFVSVIVGGHEIVIHGLKSRLRITVSYKKSMCNLHLYTESEALSSIMCIGAILCMC